MPLRSFLSIIVLTIVVLPASAPAQVVTPAVEPQAADAPSSWSSVSYAHLFQSDIDNSGAEVEREALLAILGHRFTLSDSVGLTTQATYQLSSYNFSNAGTLPGGLPGWDDIHQITLLMLADWKLNDSWSVLAGGLVRFAGESGADFGDSLTGGGLGGFNYKWSDTLRTGLLLGAMSQIEDDAAILPLPLVDWQFADSWKFRLGMAQLGAVGYGPEVSWIVSDSLKLDFGASYQNRRYRLDRNSGVGQETSVPVYTKLGWQMTPQSTLELIAGFAAGGSIRRELKGGSKIYDRDYDPTPTMGLRWNIRF